MVKRGDWQDGEATEHRRSWEVPPQHHSQEYKAPPSCSRGEAWVHEGLQHVRGDNCMTFAHAPVFSSLAGWGLQKLIEGNQGFTQGKARFPAVCKEPLADPAWGALNYVASKVWSTVFCLHSGR